MLQRIVFSKGRFSPQTVRQSSLAGTQLLRAPDLAPPHVPCGSGVLHDLPVRLNSGAPPKSYYLKGRSGGANPEFYYVLCGNGVLRHLPVRPISGAPGIFPYAQPAARPHSCSRIVSHTILCNLAIVGTKISFKRAAFWDQLHYF